MSVVDVSVSMLGTIIGVTSVVLILTLAVAYADRRSIARRLALALADVADGRRAHLESTDRADHYRSLVEAIPHMVWGATGAGAIDYYSARWCDYTGLETEQMHDSGWQSLMHSDDHQRVLRAWTRAVAGGTLFEAEFRLQQADGKYRWHLGRALPILNDDDSVVRWYGTATDIHDQKKTLQAQQRFTEQLQVVVEATDRLSNSLDAQEALQTLCELITPRFADWMSVNLVEYDGRIRNVALVHADPQKAQAVAALRGSYYIDPSVRGAVVRVIHTHRPIITPSILDPAEDPAEIYATNRSAHAELGFASAIYVPLLVRGNVVGVLTTVWAQSDQRYSGTDVAFFEELATRAAVALDEATRHSAAHVNQVITQRIMQSSEDCIAVLSLDGRLMTVNNPGSASFKAAGTVLEAGGDWVSCWRLDDRPAVSAALATARAGSAGSYQGRLQSEDAAPQWWDVAVTPITNVSGTPAQLLAVSRNITRQKNHESTLEAIATRYQAFANAIPALAFTADADGRLNFVNEQWIEYTGLSLDVSLQQGLISVTHDAEQPTLTADWFKRIESGRAHESETQLRRASDGTYRWHLMRAVRISKLDDGIAQWVGTGTDIDDQKQAEAAIAEARDAALRAATIKSQFVATMSHEIRTPISGVIGMTELLLTTELNDDQREYANVVHDSGQSLLRVINDILDYSKLDAGKLQLESVDFTVQSQVQSVSDLLRTTFDDKHVTFTASIDPNVPDSLAGDPGRLRQILLNLVGNAVKFTPSGGWVRVYVSNIRDGIQPRIRFEVKDNGIGIAPEIQSELFKAFSQGDGSTTRKYGGTGLGLSICKQLLELMNGTIGVDSTPGEGSTFWFEIDFKRGKTAGRGLTPRANGQVERRTVPRTRSSKILLVEDNEINTLLAERQLKQLGFSITKAVNGREALRTIQSADFDLVFMDLHMPEMDGFEATRQIRRLETGAPNHVPIVAMTADAQAEDRAACLAAGMDDYISKPASIERLRLVLERWLPETV